MSWRGVGDAYAASYASLCAGTGARLRELAGAARGRTLLDVGAGEGTLAVQWADAGWRVTAAEPEPSMRAAAARQHPSLSVIDAALPDLPLADGAFDVVVANFVLNHLDDPREGARALRRVAADAVIATTWAHSPSAFWADVTAWAGLAPRPAKGVAADKDFERTSAGFGRMLTDAGWHPEVSELMWTWRPTSEALWRSVDGGVAGAGAFYRGLEVGEQRRFRAAFDEIVGERASSGRVELTHTAAIAIDSRR